MKWAYCAVAVLLVGLAGKREHDTKRALRENLQWYVREQQKTMDWLYRSRWGDE